MPLPEELQKAYNFLKKQDARTYTTPLGALAGLGAVKAFAPERYKTLPGYLTGAGVGGAAGYGAGSMLEARGRQKKVEEQKERQPYAEIVGEDPEAQKALQEYARYFDLDPTDPQGREKLQAYFEKQRHLHGAHKKSWEDIVAADLANARRKQKTREALQRVNQGGVKLEDVKTSTEEDVKDVKHRVSKMQDLMYLTGEQGQPAGSEDVFRNLTAPVTREQKNLAKLEQLTDIETQNWREKWMDATKAGRPLVPMPPAALAQILGRVASDDFAEWEADLISGKRRRGESDIPPGKMREGLKRLASVGELGKIYKEYYGPREGGGVLKSLLGGGNVAEPSPADTYSTAGMLKERGERAAKAALERAGRTGYDKELEALERITSSAQNTWLAWKNRKDLIERKLKEGGLDPAKLQGLERALPIVNKKMSIAKQRWLNDFWRYQGFRSGFQDK